MTGKEYRILGGPKHGELIELEEHQKTLTCVIPVQSLATYSPPKYDEVFRTGTFVYVKALFSFPHAEKDIAVLVPKEASEAEKELFLILFIQGKGFNANR